MCEAMQRMQERLDRIEEEIRQIKTLLKPKGQQPWWEEFAGMFKDSPLFDEVVKEIEKNRQADYAAAAQEVRKRPPKKARTNAKAAQKARSK